MTEIRYVQPEDRAFWLGLDQHLPKEEFARKVRDRQGYVLMDNGKPAGLLRYHLLWDNMPFCAMLFVDWDHQGKGCGRQLMQHWETDMKSQGFDAAMTSTRADEQAQHFFRQLGYKDCGGLMMDIPGYEQPMELFMAKALTSA